MRNVYKNTSIELTQGSIINNCIAGGVPEKETIWGCVITPRCDIEHHKVNTIHYLPIVDYCTWVNVFARQLLYEEWKTNVQDSIKACLREMKVNEDVFEVGYDQVDLCNIIEASDLSKKSKKNVMDKIMSYFNQPEDTFKKYIEDNKHKKFIERLISGDLHPFYLIEDWSKCKNSFKVILLRDIRHIDYTIASEYKKGFFPTTFTKETLSTNNLKEVDDIYCIEAVIQSPYIEHIMQAFTYNFSRIGTPDLPKEEVTNILIELTKNIIV